MASQTAAQFNVLEDPARVRVLEILTAGRSSVSGLAQILSLQKSQLSHELAVLRRAALIDRTREGSMVHYSLRQPNWVQMLRMIAREC